MWDVQFSKIQYRRMLSLKIQTSQAHTYPYTTTICRFSKVQHPSTSGCKLFRGTDPCTALGYQQEILCCSADRLQPGLWHMQSSQLHLRWAKSTCIKSHKKSQACTRNDNSLIVMKPKFLNRQQGTHQPKYHRVLSKALRRTGLLEYQGSRELGCIKKAVQLFTNSIPLYIGTFDKDMTNLEGNAVLHFSCNELSSCQ